MRESTPEVYRGAPLGSGVNSTIARDCHNSTVAELEARVEQVADLMDEFDLVEAKLEGTGWRVAFKRRPNESAGASSETVRSDPNGQAIPTAQHSAPQFQEAESEPEPEGTPISSPMNGIYYSSPSPTAPAFVSEGDTVEEGQVLALIEAMKVFNEIVAPSPGRITKLVASNAQLVQPGEVLMLLAEDA